MSLWSPFAFNVYGDALPLAAPPELRVYDGVATEKQLAYAQSVFAVFCEGMRMSYVANPTEQGRLPDGSPYQITVVGNTTIMQLWVSEADDPAGRNSGISVVLSYLDGSPVPGFEFNGVPIIYLLTPENEQDSRKSTGKWKVRELAELHGGKSVNADNSGLIYYTGIQGKTDKQMVLLRNLRLGINGQAHIHEDQKEPIQLWWNSRPTGISEKINTPLPFVLTDQYNKKHAMQLVIRLAYIGEESRYQYFIDLYIGEFGDAIDGIIGQLVHIETLPEDFTIDYKSFTFRKDGKRARAYGGVGMAKAFFSIDISTDKTTTVVTKTFNDDDVLGEVFIPYSRSEDTGSPGQTGFVSEAWFGADASGDSEPIRYDSEFRVGSNYGPGERNFRHQTLAGFGYTRRGEPFEREADMVLAHHSESNSAHTIFRVVNDRGPGVVPDTESESESSFSIRQTAQGRILYSHEGNRYFTSTVINGVSASTVSGEQVSFFDEGGFVDIFIDDELDFQIRYDYKRIARSTKEWVMVGGMPTLVDTEASTTNTSDLTVTCRGEQIFTTPYDNLNAFVHITFVASDPMTGAFVVNLQEVHSITRAVSKSWIFLVDDIGAKFLHSVLPDLPAGTDVKLRSNADLLSV